MPVEDDRDNSPLEEEIFGVILLVPLFTFLYDMYDGICLSFRIKITTDDWYRRIIYPIQQLIYFGDSIIDCIQHRTF
jgi:hypothetical protein